MGEKREGEIHVDGTGMGEGEDREERVKTFCEK